MIGLGLLGFYADEEEVTGLCGLHKEYETTRKESTRQRYPWWASITVKVNVSVFHLTL